MAREKIIIRKIEKIASRQVTFSKRRRGLFKKARELCPLRRGRSGRCIFLHPQTLRVFELQTDDNPHASLMKETDDDRKLISFLRGEDPDEVVASELTRIEGIFQSGLCLVIEKKGEKMMDEMIMLQEKSKTYNLLKQNALLEHQVEEMMKGRKIGETFDSAGISKTQKAGALDFPVIPFTRDEFLDVCLKLGYAYS